jgi:hypothetical protein
VLGTDAGVLLEVAVDERSKREAAPRQLLDLGQRAGPICGLEQV